MKVPRERIHVVLLRSRAVKTKLQVQRIVADYRKSSNEFRYIFIIGHSNALDDPKAADQSDSARLRRNWDYGGRRAALIASLLQEQLEAAERERLVVLTTGELDMRDPAQPNAPENAWVEVVFGRLWKPPSYSRRSNALSADQ